MRKISFFGIFILLLCASLFVSQLDHSFRLIPEGFSITTDWIGGNDPLSRLEKFDRVLYHIKESYVEPNRVNPKQMFKKLLDHLASAVPEVRVFHSSPRKSVVYVNQKRKEFDTDLSTLFALHAATTDVLKFIRLHKKSDIADNDLEELSISGILSTLDPHSVYLSKEIYKETKVGTFGEFGGLGIVIGIRDNKLTIISPLEGTPAYRAGLKAGDFISKIGEESTVNMLLTEAVKRMRGPRGTTVKITVTRKGWPTPKDFTIVRDKINIVSVESKLLPNDVGYIKIKNFQKNTAKILRKHLRRISHKSSKNSLKGLILDLRNNPGGLLDQAISVSDVFLADGVIVTTVGLNNKYYDQEKASARGTEPPYPMAVLVNSGSASASEIVAGALQRRKRALVLGQKTFGKGTVQSLFDLPEKSALKLTVAKYLTPGDISIQSIGITPDIQTIQAFISKERIDVYPNEEPHRESTLKHHFENMPYKNNARLDPILSVRYLNHQDSEESLQEIKPKSIENLMKDFEIRFAHKVLKTAVSAKTKDILSAAKTLSPKIEKEEISKLTAVLQEQGIDWSQGPKKKALHCGTPKVYSQIKGQPKQATKAGEKIEFSVTVQNTGPCFLYQMYTISESKNYLFDDHEFLFGKLPPQSKLTRQIKIDIPKSTPSTLIPIKLSFHEAHGRIPASYKTYVSVSSISQPAFAFHYEIQNRDGFIHPGEEVEFKVFVKNIGPVPTEEASASLRQIGGRALNFRKGHIPIETLEPGKEKTFSFFFDVPQSYSENSIKLQLQLSDFVYRTFLAKKFEFPISRSKKLPSQQGKYPLAHYQPPKILTKAGKNIFKPILGQFLKIDGEIVDDEAVKDFFILVNQKKVFYQNFDVTEDKKVREKFDANIPLEPGNNRILLIARDRKDLSQRKAFVVYRATPKGQEENPLASNQH